MKQIDMKRRRFLQTLGVGFASLPFVAGLPSLRASSNRDTFPRQRLIVMFSPNGTLPTEFWPDAFDPDAALALKPILQPLAS